MYGWYSSLKPERLNKNSTDWKCMKAELPVVIKSGGFASPQYLPIIAAASESPSYKLKESKLEFEWPIEIENVASKAKLTITSGYVS